MTETSPAPGLKASARRVVGSLLLRTGSYAKQLINSAVLGNPPAPEFDPPVKQLGTYPVVAYFAEPPVRSYQLRQWLPVLEQVAAHHPVLIVTASWLTTLELREVTTLPVAFTRTLDGLLNIYEKVDVKAVVYVNNGMRNFQSLIYRRAVHVHVNHGESDKVSMVSNQAKAYDHVVVAGQAAIERHRRALIGFDFDKLVVCGRPQLDLDTEPLLRPEPGTRTVLYAPTWSGEDDANNYTSLDRYGVTIARAILARDDVRMVYKPHPRVLSTIDRGVASAHAQIVELVRQANAARGRQLHLLPFDADILGLFDGVDLLVTDISSVGLDFLYQRPQIPIVLTDRRTDRERLVAEAPIARATDVVDADTVGDVPAILAANLDTDPRQAIRAEMREHYFGFARGESSKRFLAFLGECIERRDTMLAGISTVRSSSDTGGDPRIDGQ